MSAKSCITLPAPSGFGTVSIPAILPEWLSVYVFLPGQGVQLRHVLVTERNPDAARASESYPLKVDDICEASEQTAILEAAGDALEHVLQGLLPMEGPALNVTHPAYSSPAHRLLHAMREIATLAEREADMLGAMGDAAWATDGAYYIRFPTPTSIAADVLAQWIARLADEAQVTSHERAHAARERYESSRRDTRAADAADLGMGCFQ